MSEKIIEIEELSKRYLIGGSPTEGEGLRHAIERAIKAPFAKFGNKENVLGANAKEFWALKDVSVDLKPGEVLGIIGRNGAGKSTMLKLLSRITEPTRGTIRLRGRVASLLEVGTGFHPELTGRENIYLNGAILGMSRLEIKRKFDQIVDFSGVSKFLDTPVKRYSSGMYVRLAFSVAAHLEPEILIVDEVLAVGDGEFQKKCLGKMEEVASNTGRTILFVSHNMTAVQNLCNRAIMLKSGQMVDDGSPRDVIQAYTRGVSELASIPLSERTDRKGDGGLRVEKLELLDGAGHGIEHAQSGEDLHIRLHYRMADGKPFSGTGEFSVMVSRNEQPFFVLSTDFTKNEALSLPAEGYIDFLVPKLPLSEADYSLTSFVRLNQNIEDWVMDAAELSVVGGDFFGTGKNCQPGWEGRCMLIDQSWTLGTGDRELAGGERLTG